MTFHGRIAFTNVHSDPSRAVLAVGDTYQVNSIGAIDEVTGSIQKKYSEISYILEEEEEVKEKPKPQKKAEKAAPRKKKEESSEGEYSDESGSDQSDASGGSNEVRAGGLKIDPSLLTGRRALRSRAQAQTEKQTEVEERAQNQKRLNARLCEQLAKQYKRGDVKFASKKTQVRDMAKYEAYRSASDFPSDIKPGQIYVDMKRHCVLVPNSPTTFIPLHISTIKSVSEQQQGQWTFLRINFHTASSVGNQMTFPPMEDPNNLMMNQIVLKASQTGPNNRLSTALKNIKELQKQAKNQDAASEAKQKGSDQELEKLETMSRGQRSEMLEGLVIRPNLLGKKTVGNLSIHRNGVRFSTSKGQTVDVCFSNIKHCFFQPCSPEEIIVLIHFNLKQPIMIGNKPVNDV
jgi:nucleosome binding factor SPN SPT16 subunit